MEGTEFYEVYSIMFSTCKFFFPLNIQHILVPGYSRLYSVIFIFFLYAVLLVDLTLLSLGAIWAHILSLLLSEYKLRH